MQAASAHLLVVLAVIGAALLGAAPARGSAGVAIDIGSIAVRERLVGGGEYRLPTFGVRNPGTEPTSYVLTVTYIDGQQAMQPAGSWFSFTPSELTLAGGESRPVQARLQIPPDAEPGEYAALIGPQVLSGDAGPQVGAAAGARVTFTVEPSSMVDAWLRQLGHWLAGDPWLVVLTMVVVAMFAIRFVRRRITITVARRA